MPRKDQLTCQTCHKWFSEEGLIIDGRVIFLQNQVELNLWENYQAN